MAESTPAATLYNLMTKEIPRASEVNPEVSPTLDAIIDRALRRDVNERYQTAKAMRDDLEAYIVAAGGVSHEELGDLTKTLFADIREKVQAQIKSQLATLSLNRAAESGRHTAHDLSQTQIRQMTNGLVELDDGFVDASSNATVFRVVTGDAHRASPSRRLALVAWFCIPLLALAASGLALMRSQQPPVAPTVVTTAAPPPVAPTIEPPQAATVGPVRSPGAPPATAAETATASASARAPVTATPAAPPRVVWVAPPRAAPAPQNPPSAAAPSAEAPRSTATATAAPPKPQEPPQGRTFRRDL
ncbi:MAG TPA: hypothetical protein VM925_10440, partial [Labilithrix sp.]|nr:hypothetical protein [Labilithrix sp.]